MEQHSMGCDRIGEARHPGPSCLRLGTFNPGQILGHEATVASWGPGLWCAAETSHTDAAMKLSTGRLKKSNVNSIWSPPVPCLANNTGSLRGRASGTSIHTHLPVVPYPALMQDEIAASSRLIEGLVDLGSGVNMYVASLYGPTHNATYFDPWSILSKLCTVAFEHAHAYKGPAAIVGDFNVDIDKVPHWESLVKRGWVDAAMFDAQRRGVQPKATSRGNARKSFILLNPLMVQCLIQCDVMETFDFDTHPLLIAELDLQVVRHNRCVWNLPASTDDFFFDEELLTTVTQDEMAERDEKFHDALRTGDSEEALRQINLVFEAALAGSAVDTEGSVIKLPLRCSGRSRKRLTKQRPAADPIMRLGRNGEFTPQICQPSVKIRQWTRQIRRLFSCARQLAALALKPSESAQVACHELWRAIVCAAGFPHGFPVFALETMGLFVPTAVPNEVYVKYIGDMLKLYLADEVRHWNTQVLAVRTAGIRRDFQRGGSAAFKSVKDPQAPPFQTIDHTVQVEILPQRWTRAGLSKLLYNGDLDKFQLDLPVVFQKQEAFILGTEGPRVVLDRRVHYRDTRDLRLWQRQVISNMDDLQAKTADAWSSMWLRDPKDDSIDNWPEAIENLRSLHDVPTMQYEPLQVVEWKRHVSTTKKASARGACAYTPRELLLMPTALCQWMLDLFMAVETGLMQWPPSIMTARVVMLTKPDEAPTHPLQVRPITITSRLYRTWAKYRSLQIFQHFQQMLPPEVAGTAAGVSADMIAATVAMEVEEALHTQCHRLGLTIDLVKCYNQVPRLPVIAALKKLGVPEPYLHAVWSMFQQLDRILEIAGCTGKAMKSTTGIPEGCCFSIVSMLALTVWATQHVEACHEDVECLAYADNWAVLAHCVDTMQAAADTLHNFVTALRMKISPSKSWVWATHTKDRRLLRTMAIGGEKVPLKLFATELGCDVSYCRRVTKKVVKKRFAKTTRVLRRVAARKLPKQCKSRMTSQLTTGIAGYGSELTYTTPAEFRTMRAACCQAVGRSRSGVNPYLALNVIPGAVDPEIALLKRKCNFWRRFLKAFPYRREQFFHRMAAYNGGRSPGPACVFARALRDQGWSCHAGAWLVHDRGWTFNWYYSPRALVVKMLHTAWQLQICAKVQSRKHFDLASLDIPAVHQSLKHLPPDSLESALNYVTGKHVTCDALGHYARGGGVFACPICGEYDGREHRIFHCNGLAEVRAKYPKMIAWMHEQCEGVRYFGLLQWDLQWLDEKCLRDLTVPPLVRPLELDPPEALVIFTDGSAYYSDCYTVAIAAGAWLQVDGSAVVRQGASPVPGIFQTAYRGEIWSVVLALQQAYAVNIHSDCSAVCTVGAALVSARVAGTPPVFPEHDDPWGLVWELLLTRPSSCVAFTKVKAHQDISKLSDLGEIWKATMNNKVDQLAKTCAKKFGQGSLRARAQFCKDRQHAISMMHDFFLFWGESNAIAVKKLQTQQPVRSGNMPEFQMLIDPLALQVIHCDIPDHVLLTCPYGSVFARRVCQYFDGLQWDFQQPAVSLLELYIDFSITTGSVAPVFCPFTTSRGSRGIYKLPDCDVLADVQQESLQLQSRVWQRVVKWCLKHWESAPWTTMCQATSMARYGYPKPHNGLCGQPKFRSNTAVCNALWTYLHATRGAQRCFRNKWVPPRAVVHAGG
eukprot:Skav228548  [mRNA]  locus=scaffold1887:556581:561575:- [translate_table: standard]